jgi:hypothetical protein
MTPDAGRRLALSIELDDDADRDALEQALLRARATELAEVRRNQVRLGAGYGDDTTRDTMTDQQRTAQRRWTMLDRLLGAVQDRSDEPRS